MKTPVDWVTASLTVAIVVTVTFLIATTSHGATGLSARPVHQIDMPRQAVGRRDAQPSHGV